MISVFFLFLFSSSVDCCWNLTRCDTAARLRRRRMVSYFCFSLINGILCRLKRNKRCEFYIIIHTVGMILFRVLLFVGVGLITRLYWCGPMFALLQDLFLWVYNHHSSVSKNGPYCQSVSPSVRKSVSPLVSQYVSTSVSQAVSQSMVRQRISHSSVSPIVRQLVRQWNSFSINK